MGDYHAGATKTRTAIAALISDLVSCEDAAFAYGRPVLRGGFIACPWHIERTPSCKIYEGARGFHCFGCGESGSVIDLVRAWHCIGFISACQKLIDDFALPVSVDGGGTYRQKKKQREAIRSIIKMKEARETAEARLLDADRAVAACCVTIRDTAPGTPDDAVPPAFLDALWQLGLAELEAEEALLAWQMNKSGQ